MTASNYTRAACQLAGGQNQFSRGPWPLALRIAAAVQEAARTLQHQQGYPLPPTGERGKVKP